MCCSASVNNQMKTPKIFTVEKLSPHLLLNQASSDKDNHMCCTVRRLCLLITAAVTTEGESYN